MVVYEAEACLWHRISQRLSDPLPYDTHMKYIYMYSPYEQFLNTPTTAVSRSP